MSQPFFDSVDLNCRKQRVRLLVLACSGVLAFCIVSWVVVPRICPTNATFRTHFSSGKLTGNVAANARRGLHSVAMTGPFERYRCLYLRVGTNIWFVETRTPIER